MDESVDILLILSGLNSSENIPPIKNNLRFKPHLTFGFTIEEIEDSNSDEILNLIETRSTAVIKILETLKNPTVVLNFYRKLTENLDFKGNSLDFNDDKTVLLSDEDKKLITYDGIHKTTISVTLLGNISENDALTKEFFSDLSAAVPVVGNLLKSSSEPSNDLELKDIQIRLLMNTVMLILSYVNDRVNNKKMTSSDWAGLKTLLPELERCKTSTDNDGILVFIEQLRNIVLTHGVVLSNLNESEKENKFSSEEKKYIPTEGNLDNYNNISNSQQTDSPPNERYKRAFDDLCSPQLPMRGHALLELSKLLDDHEETALKNKEKLLSIFEHHLKDEDSYIYLMAIRGLVSLCSAFPDKILPILIKQLNSNGRSAADRAKIAEALVRVTRRLGDVLPHHRNLLLNGILSGANEKDDLIRTACVSNLGEICKYLKFSIGPVLYEIFTLLDNFIKCDESPEVRRASVLVITLLLQGLGLDAIKVSNFSFIYLYFFPINHSSINFK